MATPITSYQKLLIEKNQDEDTPELGPRPEYFDFGKNHVDYVGNFLMPLIQKFPAGKDDFGRKSALGC